MTAVRSRRAVAIMAATLACSTAWFFAGRVTAGAVGTFGSPVVVSSLNDSEPGIDVYGSTVYINAIPGLNIPGPSPSHLWRSDNGGTTWTLTTNTGRAALPGGGDFDITVAGDTGNLAMTDLWLGSATVGASSNKGQSWTAQPYSTPVQDRQWVASAAGGRVYHATHQIPSGLVVATSIDGGVTYPIQTVAATPADQTGCVCPPGLLIAENGGLLADKVGLIYSTSVGGVKFARSANGAATFTNVNVSPASSADTISAFPVVANAGGNKLVAVWMEVIGGRSRIRGSTSTNWGSTWSTPQTIVSAGTPLYPWVAATGNTVAVSLFHTDAIGTPGNVPSSAQWFERYVESTNFGSTWSALTTVDSTPVKAGPVCTEGINCSEDRELGDFQAVSIDPLGRAYLTYTRSINGSSDTEIRFVRQL